MRRVFRIALITSGLLLVGLSVVWAFREYAGPGAEDFLTVMPFPCPFHYLPSPGT